MPTYKTLCSFCMVNVHQKNHITRCPYCRNGQLHNLGRHHECATCGRRWNDPEPEKAKAKEEVGD